MTIKTDRNRRILALAYPGHVSLDLVGPLEVFGYVNVLLEESLVSHTHGYTIELIAPSRGPVESMSGVKLCADHCIDNFSETADILLVPGMKKGTEAYREGRTLKWIEEQASRSKRVVSVCSGAWMLAYAGLLENKTVTTHWNHGRALQKAFPNTVVDYSRIYCKSGNIYSSAGVTAGIDLALSLVEEDYGRDVALKIAKRMVVFLKRQGDQSQFSDLLEAQQSNRFRLLIEWLEKNLQKELSVGQLAEQCSMSPRNFTRAFTDDIGIAPMRYVNKRRLEKARTMLEGAEHSIKTIASRTGFNSLNRFSAAFKYAFHTTPLEYRKRFH